MDKTRRLLLQTTAGLGALAPFLKLQQAMAATDLEFGSDMTEARAISEQAHTDLMMVPEMNMHGGEQVAMLVYPGMTMLDMVGPQYFFAAMMGSKVHLVCGDPDLKPIMGDTGFAIIPTMHFSDCPKDLDVLFAPGGTGGTINAMNDPETVDFMADRGSRAGYVTSVCTGSLILGQAGLIDSKRATSHWAAHHLLPQFGAIAVDQRVVRDGNTITGAGVSAGLDLGIAILNELRGEAYARTVQLNAEYAPEPMFVGGTPSTTPTEIYEPMHQMFAPFVVAAEEAARSRRTGS